MYHNQNRIEIVIFSDFYKPLYWYEILHNDRIFNEISEKNILCLRKLLFKKLLNH